LGRTCTPSPGERTSIEITSFVYPIPLCKTLTSSKRYFALVPIPTVLRTGVNTAPNPSPFICKLGGAI